MDYEDAILSSNSPSFGSQDSGFDSVLDLNDSISSNTSSPIQNLIFKTPTKYSHLSSITPIKLNRSSLKADLSGIYYSSIHQQSPQQRQQQYSAFISEYDTQTSCLLRSPIIQQSPCSPSYCITPRRTSQLTQVTQKIKCKPFISIKQKSTQEFNDTKKQTSSKNVQEFLQNLFKNHYLSSDSLIGFKMGIEHVDILSELVKRSMLHVVDLILVKCKPKDYANFYAVNKSWKNLIGNNSRYNKARIKYLRNRNRYLNVTKENHDTNGGKQRLKQEKTNGCFTPVDTNRLITTFLMSKLELPLRKSPLKKSPLKRISSTTYSKHTISPIKFYPQTLPIENKISCLSLKNCNNKSPSKNICSKLNKKNLKRL